MAPNDDASLIEGTHKERNEAIFDYYYDLQECYSEVEESETMKRRKSRSAACAAMLAVADRVKIDPVDDAACLSVPYSLISSPSILSSARTHQTVLPDSVDDAVYLGLLLRAISSSTSRSWTHRFFSALPSHLLPFFFLFPFDFPFLFPFYFHLERDPNFSGFTKETQY
ncbi:hypothetical protein ACFX13_047730 [Malus domestica]